MTRERIAGLAAATARAYREAEAAGLSRRKAINLAANQIDAQLEARRAEQSAAKYRALRSEGTPAQEAYRAVVHSLSAR